MVRPRANICLEKKGSRRIIIFLVILVVGLSGFGLGYRFRSHIKKPIIAWRAASHVEKAEALLQEEDWKGAHQLALASYKLAPSHEALSVLFRSSMGGRLPKILDYGSALLVHPKSTFQEKLEVLTLIQLLGDDLRFMVLYNTLSEEERQNNDIILLKAQFLASRGGFQDAWNLMEDYFESGGQDDRFKLLQAGLLLLGQGEEPLKRGQELISELIRAESPVSQEAFGLLWNVGVGNIHTDLFAQEDVDALVEKSGAAVRQQLIAEKVRLARKKGDAEGQETVLRQAVQEFGPRDPVVLCNWLTTLGRLDLILEVVSAERGMESLALYDHRLRALSAVEGPEAGKVWLNTPHPDSSDLQVWLSRAILAKADEDSFLLLECWRESFSLADVLGTREAYLNIYRTALQVGDPESGARALTEASQRRGRSFPSSREVEPLLHHLYSEGKLSELRFIFKALAESEPGNVTLMNNLIYVSLVLGDKADPLVEVAKRLVEESPGILGLRTTLALGLLQKGSSEEALNLLNQPDLDWKGASPADLAIKALAFESVGRSDQAATLRKSFDDASLTSAERKAFLTIQQEIRGNLGKS